MATSTYEQVLHEAEKLSPEEQRRLREELAAKAHQEAVRQAMARLDDLAARISTKWQGTMSAAEAVNEQRREL